MTPFFYLSDGYLLGMTAWLLAGIVALAVCLKLRRRWRSRPHRLRAVHAGLSVWFVLAALTLPELYCALFYDQTDSFSLTNVSRRWDRMHVETNDAGYRDARPFPPTIPADRRRICFVGDSFTFGHGVPDVADRFSDRIAAELEQARPGKFLVSNLGLPGLDVRQLVDQLQEALERGVEMERAVYAFVLNDIEYFDERTAVHYQNIAELSPRFFLFRDTYFYNLLYFRVQQFRQPEVRGYYSYLRESYETEPWHRLARKLDELRELCDRHGVELRLVVFPFLHNLGPDYPFAEAHRRLMDYCRENGVRSLDLEPVLTPHVDEGLVVNRYDAHPNERAHALAAEAIQQHLLDDLFSD